MQFQSTRPRGARLSPGASAERTFQSTRPRGARRRTCSQSELLGFNPRARAGRDRRTPTMVDRSVVSIHAPARGATVDPTRTDHVAIEFQSTRPRGARPILPVPAEGIRFQSTRPRGARHAHVYRGRFSERFNPRARAGRDRRDTPCGHCHPSFNPRARAGRDLSSASAMAARSFNPRARAGRDAFVGERGRHAVSIHAPARGATPRCLGSGTFEASFNPRARAGRDASPLRSYAVASCFNPRARAGRDPGQRTVRHVARSVSIHAPARGATRSP